MRRDADYSDTGGWFVDDGYWHGYLNPVLLIGLSGRGGAFSYHPDAAGNVGVAHYVAMTDDALEFNIAQ